MEKVKTIPKRGKARAHVVIKGMVQGVLFRHETRARAQVLSVTGWVMNRDDGGVEAVFEGEKDKVLSIVRWCYKGPSGAVVGSVDVKWETYSGKFKGFGVEYVY